MSDQQPTVKGVLIETSVGAMVLELYWDHTPKTCKNFYELAKKGYYNGVIFHRVIRDFVIQGGDPTGTGRGGESIYGKQFEDEVTPKLKHTGAGILSMANSGPNTNGSQFFISLAATPWLDGKHTIFGRIHSGMQVVKRLSMVQTGANDRTLVFSPSVMSGAVKAAELPVLISRLYKGAHFLSPDILTSPHLRWKDGVQVLQHLNRHSHVDSAVLSCFLSGLACQKSLMQLQRGIELVTNMGERNELGWRGMYMVHYAANNRVDKMFDILDSIIKDNKANMLNVHDFRLCMFKAGKSRPLLIRILEKWRELKANGVKLEDKIELAFLRMFTFYRAHDVAKNLYLEMKMQGIMLHAEDLAMLVNWAKDDTDFWKQEMKELGMERQIQQQQEQNSFGKRSTKENERKRETKNM